MSEEALRKYRAEELFKPGSSFLAEVARIELATRRSVSSSLSGNWKSAFRGQGLMFSDLREYQPGDDIKNVHWKASARSGKIYVKSYEEERELKLMLAIDISASMNFGAPKAVFRKALEFAAAVTLLAQRAKDAVGLCLFSDEVHEYIPPARSRHNLRRIVSALASERSFEKQSNLSAPLLFLRDRLPENSVIFVVSDFFCRPFREELKSLCARHDVILSAIIDDIEMELPRVGIVEFEDAESGERIVIDTSSLDARYALRKLQRRRLMSVMEPAQLAGADFMVIKSNPIRPLSDLMKIRVARYR